MHSKERSIVSHSAVSLLSATFLLPVIYLSYCGDRSLPETMYLQYTAAFLSYMGLLHLSRHFGTAGIMQLVALGICARLSTLAAIPALSDDIYRYLWDGYLWHMGLHPYDQLPSEIAATAAGYQDNLAYLLPKLNSPDYYSVYPPLSQWIFRLATMAGSGPFQDPVLLPLLLIRVVVLLAEAVTIWGLYRLLKHFDLPLQSLLWYVLNPLVILEFCANVHLEAVATTLMVLCLLLFVTRRQSLSAICLGGAAIVKLHPLLLLPFFIKRTGSRHRITFLTAAGISVLVPLAVAVWPPACAMERLHHILMSLRLYFEVFEFNAGAYYAVRWAGGLYYGYNPIAITGKVMLAASLVVICICWFKMTSGKRSLVRAAYYAYLGFFLLSTTVHPWYILILLPYSLLAGSRLVIAWSYLSFLSYTAYSRPGWEENLYLVAMEYTCIFVMLAYEIRKLRRNGDSQDTDGAARNGHDGRWPRIR